MLYLKSLQYRLALFALLSAAFILFLTSCRGSKANSEQASILERIVGPWEGEKSTVLVLAGEAFPEESGIADFVAWEYGLTVEKGLARFLYWPGTFEKRSASLRLLRNIALEERPEILVTIAAPSGTLNELIRIRSQFPEIKIVSIFPLDEALPVEAVSDMVIDIDPHSAQSEEIDTAMIAEEATALNITADEASALLLGAVFSMEMSEQETESPNLSRTVVAASALLEIGMGFAANTSVKRNEKSGLHWQYAQAVDADTGLKSRRHILITKEAENF